MGPHVWNVVDYLVPPFATLGHGTQHVGNRIARFRAFFAMIGKTVLPNHPFES